MEQKQLIKSLNLIKQINHTSLINLTQDTTLGARLSARLLVPTKQEVVANVEAEVSQCVWAGWWGGRGHLDLRTGLFMQTVDPHYLGVQECLVIYYTLETVNTFGFCGS